MKHKKALIVFLVIAVFFSIGAMQVSAKGFAGRSSTRQNRRMMPGMMGHRRYLSEDVENVFEENQKALDALVDEYAAAGRLTASEADLLKLTGYEHSQSRRDVIEKLFAEGDFGRREWTILMGHRVRNEEDREALLETLVTEGSLTADEAEALLKSPYEVMKERVDLIDRLISAGKLTEDEADKLETVCGGEDGRLRRSFGVGRGRFAGPCFFSEALDDRADTGDD